MKILSAIMGALARTPEFVPVCIFPALILALCVLHTLLGMRKLYPAEGAALTLLGAVLIACRADARSALVCGGLLLLWTGLLSPLFLIRVPRKRERLSAEEKLYRKFRGEPLRSQPAPAAPAKVCRFEEPAVLSAQECGMRLTHAEEMLARLKTAPLASSDRLETEALSRTLSGYREKKLTSEELRMLNDCLASVLKLTAKYKL